MPRGDERRADVVILTAIKLEFDAVLKVEAGTAAGSSWKEAPGPSGLPVAYRRFVGKSDRPLRVAVALAPNMGATAVVNTLLPLVTALRARCVAMCGVCAGPRKKVALGDVVAADRLYYHDTGKQLPGRVEQDLRTYNQRDDWKVALERLDPVALFGGEAWFLARPLTTEWREHRTLVSIGNGDAEPWTAADPAMTDAEWQKLLAGLKQRKLVAASGRKLTAAGRRFVDELRFAQKGKLPDVSPAGPQHPLRLHVAPIGSGARVVEDEQIWTFVSQAMRKTLGIEMEAAAIGELAHHQRQHQLDWVVMKGVMDFADHGRDDHFKEYAARASAECLIAFLRDQLAVGVAVGDVESGAGHALPGGGGAALITETTQQIAGAQAGPDQIADTPPGDGNSGDRCDHVHLHDRLRKLTETLFEQLLLEARADRTLFAPKTASLADRVLDVVRHAEVDQGLCRRLTGLLDERAPWTRAVPLASPPERPGHGGNIAGSVPAATVATDTTAPAPAPVGMPSAEVDKHLARVKREVAAAVKARPRPFAQLAARIGCDPAVLPDHLVELRGSVVARYLLEVYEDHPPTTEEDGDRDALRSVLFTVLPYVSDWRAEVAACCARGEGERDIVELRYRSNTIAEAVMAGWVGRQCCFEHKSGTEPYGVGAVQLPATAQTALFTSEQHLLDAVVKQLVSQLKVGGLNPYEERTRVQAELETRSERRGLERMRYYFLFHDAASPDNSTALWNIARTTLHGDTGLPSLVLVRMLGKIQPDEAKLESRIAAMLQPPRTPPRS